PCCDPAGADQHSGDEETEDESADVSEECDTAPTGFGLDKRVVALEELVQKPATQEYPCRDADRNPPQQRADARVGIEHHVCAEHSGDRAAGAESRHLRI